MFNFILFSRASHACFAALMLAACALGAGCFIWVGIHVPAPFDNNQPIIPVGLWLSIFWGMGLTCFVMAGYACFRLLDELFFPVNDRRRITGIRKVPAGYRVAYQRPRVRWSSR